MRCWVVVWYLCELTRPRARTVITRERLARLREIDEALYGG